MARHVALRVWMTLVLIGVAMSPWGAGSVMAAAAVAANRQFDIGYCAEMATPERAMACALAQCRALNDRECEPVLTCDVPTGGWFAIAVHGERLGFHLRCGALSEEEARRIALEGCTNSYGPGCEVGAANRESADTIALDRELCGTPVDLVDRNICEKQPLLESRQRVETAYRARMAATPPAARLGLEAAQRRFLASLRTCTAASVKDGGTDGCLATVLKRRVVELEQPTE